MLEKSVELDPNYAPTWAQIGRAYTAQASVQFGGREQYMQAQAAYEKSLSLDSAQLQARMCMANLLTDTGRVEQAVPLLRDALKTTPTMRSCIGSWDMPIALEECCGNLWKSANGRGSLIPGKADDLGHQRISLSRANMTISSQPAGRRDSAFIRVLSRLRRISQEKQWTWPPMTSTALTSLILHCCRHTSARP